MRTHVALLRGINVLGRNKVAMADLRDSFSSLGHREVTTYLQSGNVVFGAARPAVDCAALAGELEATVALRLDVRPIVVVLSREELNGVVRVNPYPQLSAHEARRVGTTRVLSDAPCTCGLPTASLRAFSGANSTVEGD